MCVRCVRAVPKDTSAILPIMEMPPATRSSARAAMDRLHADGSPVAGPESADEVIRVGWRRWQSFERRHKKATSSGERVEDLAKGLRDAFESERQLVGPLMEDYRHLASILNGVFAAGRTSRPDRSSADPDARLASE